MALSNTTLAAALGLSDTVMSVTSGTGFPGVGVFPNGGYGQVAQVDGEMLFVVTALTTTLMKIRERGAGGTAAMAHDILAPVSTSAVHADFAAWPVGTAAQRPPQVDDMLTIGQNIVGGTLVLPTKNTTYVITKATALASSTIPAPTVSQNGLRLTFTSQTAAAHVLTATALLNNGLTGSPFTTATFAAFAGAGTTWIANNGLWNVIASPVTGSTVVLT
jgi:hypothetical protein